MSPLSFDHIDWRMPAEYSPADRIAIVEWLLHPQDENGRAMPGFIGVAVALRLLDVKEQS